MAKAKPEAWKNSHARRPTNQLKFIGTGGKKIPAITTINPKIPMLISKTMTNAISEQIGNEFGASMQYVAIAVTGRLKVYHFGRFKMYHPGGGVMERV